MTKRAEKAELDLIKAESVKTVQGGSGEALFQDMLGNLKEFMEGQLQCSICNEIYVYPSGQSKFLSFYFYFLGINLSIRLNEYFITCYWRNLPKIFYI